MAVWARRRSIESQTTWGREEDSQHVHLASGGLLTTSHCSCMQKHRSMCRSLRSTIDTSFSAISPRHSSLRSNCLESSSSDPIDSSDDHRHNGSPGSRGGNTAARINTSDKMHQNAAPRSSQEAEQLTTSNLRPWQNLATHTSSSGLPSSSSFHPSTSHAPPLHPNLAPFVLPSLPPPPPSTLSPSHTPPPPPLPPPLLLSLPLTLSLFLLRPSKKFKVQHELSFLCCLCVRCSETQAHRLLDRSAQEYLGCAYRGFRVLVKSRIVFSGSDFRLVQRPFPRGKVLIGLTSTPNTDLVIRDRRYLPMMCLLLSLTHIHLNRRKKMHAPAPAHLAIDP